MARPNASPGDPLEAVNAKSFAITQDVDHAVIGPVSHAYAHIIPEPVRDGIRNFQHNFGEPIIFLNFLLQHKIGKAAETVGRFALNTTVGIGGVFDVARKKPVNLPHRPNGFADTLGFYGVQPGPFLFLPIVGPTTVRDLFGGSLDAMVMPRAIGKPVNTPPYSATAGILRSLSDRVEFDQKLNQLRDESPSPYTALRDYYLQRRQAEIDGLRHPHAKPAPDTTAPLPLASAAAGNQETTDLPAPMRLPPTSADPPTDGTSPPLDAQETDEPDGGFQQG